MMFQSHWGEGTRKIKEQYEQSLFDLRGRIDDVANCKTVAEVRNKRAQYELGEFQKRVEDTARVIDNDKSKIKNLEREICALRENKELLNKSLKEQLADLDKYRLNRDETWSNLVDLLDKLDDELFRRISVEYNNQTLREHIEFLKQIHEKGSKPNLILIFLTVLDRFNNDCILSRIGRDEPIGRGIAIQRPNRVLQGSVKACDR
jgi:chromosome segregation ATPase